MRPLSIYCLIIAAYVIGFAVARAPLHAVFKVVTDANRNGNCAADYHQELQRQFPDMQDAVASAHHQFGSYLTRDSPPTQRLLSLQLGIRRGFPFAGRMALSVWSDISGVNEAISRVHMGPDTELESTLPVIVCDSTPIRLVRGAHPIPYAPLVNGNRQSYGQFFGTTGRRYWYFLVPELAGVAQVPKTVLPGLPGVVDERPFPPYPADDQRSGFGPSFCADENNRVWHLVLERFLPRQGQRGHATAREPDHVRVKQLVIVLCPPYFRQVSPIDPQNPRRITNTIDLAPQAENTRLEQMRPAWLIWFWEIVTGMRSLHHPHAYPLQFGGVYTYNHPQPRPQSVSKDDFTHHPDVKVLTASACVHLAAYQRAAPPPDGFDPEGMPAVFNPACIGWFVLAARLEQAGQRPQDWATGEARGFLQVAAPPGGGGGGPRPPPGGGGGGNNLRPPPGGGQGPRRPPYPPPTVGAEGRPLPPYPLSDGPPQLDDGCQDEQAESAVAGAPPPGIYGARGGAPVDLRRPHPGGSDDGGNADVRRTRPRLAFRPQANRLMELATAAESHAGSDDGLTADQANGLLALAHAADLRADTGNGLTADQAHTLTALAEAAELRAAARGAGSPAADQADALSRLAEEVRSQADDDDDDLYNDSQAGSNGSPSSWLPDDENENGPYMSTSPDYDEDGGGDNDYNAGNADDYGGDDDYDDDRD